MLILQVSTLGRGAAIKPPAQGHAAGERRADV